MNSKDNVFVIKLADVIIRCSCIFKETASFFDGFIKHSNHDVNDTVSIDEYDKQLWAEKGNILDAYGEYSLLCGGISDYLMKHNCCLIHAVAFRYKDRAYLITGAPGIGKSTQIKYLIDMYPNQFSIICGDRPCLEFKNDGTIFVNPTPWNGKENWYGAKSCELAGVFCLSRDDYTEISVLSDRLAVMPVFLSLISRHEEEKDIQLLAQYTERIVSKYPVFKYVNGGVPSSTVTFYDTINREVSK